MTLYVCVHKKIIPVSLSYSQEFSSYLPVKFINFLKSRLIFNMFYCFWMFVNKISRAHFSKCKRCFNVKSSTYYYFLVKTNILADFQVCISVPLISWSKIKNFTDQTKNTEVNVSFMCFSRVKRFKSLVFT